MLFNAAQHERSMISKISEPSKVAAEAASVYNSLCESIQANYQGRRALALRNAARKNQFRCRLCLAAFRLEASRRINQNRYRAGTALPLAESLGKPTAMPSAE